MSPPTQQTPLLENQEETSPYSFDMCKLRLQIGGYLATLLGGFMGTVSYFKSNNIDKTNHDLTTPLSRISFGVCGIGSLILTANYATQGIGKCQTSHQTCLNILENMAPLVGAGLFSAGSFLLASAHSEAGSTPAFKDPVHGNPQELAGGIFCIAGASIAGAGFFGRRAVNAASNAYDAIKNYCRR